MNYLTYMYSDSVAGEQRVCHQSLEMLKEEIMSFPHQEDSEGEIYNHKREVIATYNATKKGVTFTWLHNDYKSVTKGELIQGRKVVHAIYCEASGTFSAVNEARKILKDLGYEIGSMCRDEPIGFADADEVNYIAKWYNLSREDKAELDGVMISDDFREGDVNIVFFNEPKTKA